MRARLSSFAVGLVLSASFGAAACGGSHSAHDEDAGDVDAHIDEGHDAGARDAGRLVPGDDAGTDAATVSTGYCPEIAPPVRELGTCPGADLDGGPPRTHTLTLQVRRGRTFLDRSDPTTDARGELVVAVFTRPLLCRGCNAGDPAAFARLPDVDLAGLEASARITVPNVPEGGSWILAWLDDDLPVAGDPDVIDYGDLFNLVPVAHLTCEDAALDVTLDVRMVSLSGEVSVSSSALPGDVTGAYGFALVDEPRLGMDARRDPLAYLIESSVDLSTPIRYGLRGYFGPPAFGTVGFVVAPARLYYIALLDADGSGFEGDPTPGDVLSIETGLLGTRPHSLCLDDSSLEFHEDVSLAVRVPGH